MHKLTLSLVVLVLIATTVSAQAQKESPCRLRFALAEKTALDRPGVWPDDAIRWGAKDGKKKFPELCEASPEDADFVLAGERNRLTKEYSVPVGSGSVAPSATPTAISQIRGLECNQDYLTGEVSCDCTYQSRSKIWETALQS